MIYLIIDPKDKNIKAIPNQLLPTQKPKQLWLLASKVTYKMSKNGNIDVILRQDIKWSQNDNHAQKGIFHIHPVRLNPPINIIYVFMKHYETLNFFLMSFIFCLEKPNFSFLPQWLRGTSLFEAWFEDNKDKPKQTMMFSSVIKIAWVIKLISWWHSASSFQACVQE